MGSEGSYDIEELLEQPCWVIDLLPSQVPADSAGQFFAVERVLLDGPELRRRFARTLLMLNCYHDFLVIRGERDHGKASPQPKKFKRWVVQNEEGLSILLPAEQALITVPTDSTYMALYNPTPSLLEEVRLVASANGLFVWMPGQA